jgi:hypothetical protein
MVVEAQTMRPGKERCKAWIYSVINPLLNGLEIEGSFLAKRNWTFRRYNRDLEFIRPIRAFVDYQSRPNWDDFVTSNPAVRGRVEDREVRREELRKACNAAFEDLVKVTDFRRKVSECLNAFVKETLADPASIFHPNVEPHEGVAEIIVNNITELPDHYGPHRFWSRFRDELMQFRRGPTFENADRAGVELERSNDNLSAEVTKLRSDLAAEYDIPWAPYYDESLSLPGR